MIKRGTPRKRKTPEEIAALWVGRTPPGPLPFPDPYDAATDDELDRYFAAMHDRRRKRGWFAW